MAPTNRRREPSMLEALGLASGVGIQLAVAVLAGIGLGYLADRAMHTAPWLLMAGLVLGIVVGTLSAVRRVRRQMARYE
jgi:ATP synthase protein I